MKNSTFSAQVANNLLTVLQGYSRTIRLLLVMFLTLTVSANAWAADYELVSFSDIKTNDVIIIVGTKSSTAYAMKNTGTPPTPIEVTISNSKITSTATDITFTATNNGDNTITFVSTTSGTLYCTNANNGVKIGDQTGNNTKFSFDSSVNRLKNIGQTRWLGIYNTQDWRCYTTASAANISGTTTTFYRKVTAAPSHTITATSNNNSYGTVSVSGTTITATPNAGYRVKSGDAGYTVTSGTADVTNNGDNTFSVTPSSNCTITINFEAIPKYTVTWNVNGDVYETTQVTEGSKPTFPATPSSCDVTSNTFYGWATATWDGKINDVSAKTIYTSANNMPAEAATYYAVFCEGGGGSVLINEPFDNSSTSDLSQAFNSSTFPNFSGDTEKAYKSKYGGVKFGTSSAVGYITSKSLNLSTAFTVTLDACKYSSDAGNIEVTVGTQTKTISNSSLGAAGTFKTFTLEFDAATSTSTVKIATSQKRAYIDNVIIATGGGASNFITTCAAGDPCDALQAPDVTATATANSITLSWATVPGATSYNVYNYTTEELDETTNLTYTFNGLNPETEYEWEVEAVSATCNGKGTNGTTTTSATPCEKLDDATGLTVVTDFVQDGQTYVKFSWTPADNTKNYATNQKLCFGKVDEAGTCVDNLAKNFTWTGDLKSKLEPGEYWWSIQALGDGVNYCDGDVVNGTNFTIEAPKASITLSELGVTTTDNTTYYVGETYTLPSTSSQSCAGKQLVGWSTVEVAETDTKPTENYYELGEEVTLAATQTFYAVFATKGGVPSTDYNQITSIEDLTDGNYVIAYGYNTTSPTIILKAETKDETTLVATSAGPTDNKYTDPAASNIWEIKKTNTTYTLYNAATSKYIQATNTPSLKLADADPTEFQISYSTDHWKIKLNTANTYQLVGYTNASGNYFQTKESPSNSYKIQLYKSASTVVYSAYTTSCIPTYSITYDFAGGTGSHCSNTSVPQGDPYTICEEEPTKEGHTFLGWWDGTIRRAAGETINPTGHVTLTAQWQIKTYTVIWSNNGATTPVGYNHGDTLEVPEAPESCDGEKEFVGWTDDNTFTYHATDAPTPLFKTTTATVTADKTYYAVFATPPGTGGGGGGSETNTTLDFTAQGYANETAISNLTVDGVTATFAKGSNSNAPKYYTTGNAIRAYGGNTITLSANQITAATFTFGSSDGSNDIAADCGSWESPTWTGDATDEVVFTIGGTSGNRRITSIAVTYISGGGSGSYSDYTTICQQIESIEVQEPQTDFHLTDDFTIGEGKVMATLSDGITEVDVTSLATFSGYNMEVVGTYTVTVTYMGATATYNINVQPLDNAWVLTWNVSGKTNTGLGPRSVTKGSAIGTLPVPDSVPAACAGKTFMGWTTSNIVPSDGVGIVYITEETVPTDNTTYYAVFATVNNFCTQKPIDQIAPDSKVVIVAVASLDAGGTTGKAISSRTSDDGNNLAGDEVSIYDKTINTPHSTCIWTLYKDGEQYYFKQGDYFLNAVDEEGYTNLKWNETKELWNITSVPTYLNTYYMESTHVPDTYIEWYIRRLCFKTYYDIENENGEFDMQFFVTANANGEADITDYTTGCAEYTITYYGFHGGYSTSCSSDGTIVLPVNSLHTVPDCGDVVKDHTNLGREFLNVWMTQPHGGHTFKPGDTFILTQDTTLYAQWKMETTSDVTTLPTDIEDLAGTDIYVYGGTTLNIQPGTTTINSLTLKGGLQADGSYKMPTVWVPEGATLVRNSNKINLDLIVNAKTYYPFAVPFAAKNNENVEYLDPVLAAASTYGTHFAIKTYDGARRADVGEDKANNWVRVLRGETLQPGVGYIITALTYPAEDTATIRIPMTVPNTWFQNGEQAAVSTTVRNTIAVTAHGGTAANEHQRHAGWNFVANPYLTSFAGGNVANDGDLAYINGELIIEGSYVYGGDPVPYVTIPAYDFAYYSQHKLSDVKLSPEWSFFVQVGTGGTMNFTTAGRQQAPASIAARNAEERPVKMDVDLILSDNHSSDQTGLIICDRYSDAYEIGCDLEKLFGSAYNLSVYTLMEDNTPLAFQALAIRSSMQVIPVGYRAPEQGEYTFRLNEATSSIDLLNEQYEQLVLVDYQTGELTNLLYTDYTFYSERTQSNSRFAIYAVPRQNAPTDLPNAIGSDEEVRKVIYNDHLYILRDGNVYNGMGQKM